MPHNLPPLSGAILVSNPRRNPDMARYRRRSRTRSNPNDRRRINMLTRAVIRKGGPGTAKAAVSQWFANRKKAKGSRPAWMQRAEGEQASSLLHWITTEAKPSSDASRDKRARIKRQVAKEMAAQGNKIKSGSYGKTYSRRPGKTKKGKKYALRGRSYASRAVGSKAYRYRLKGKMERYSQWHPDWKISGLGDYMVVDQEGLRRADEMHIARRAVRKGKKGRLRAGKRRTQTRRVAGRRDAAGRFKKKYGGMRTNGLALTNRRHRSRRNPRRIQRGVALRNGIALDNVGGVSLDGLKNFTTEYAVPGIIGGGLAGAGHAAMGYWGWTAKLQDVLVKIPAVGEPAATYFPYTIQGFLAALAAAAGAAASQRYGAPKLVTDGLALSSAGFLAFGAGIDSFNYVASMAAAKSAASPMSEEEAMAGLALDNMGALAYNLGGIALDNRGHGYGDGMAYETAPLTAQQPASYGQATLGDAYYSGADFSGVEGQALLNGHGAWHGRFGGPAVRTKRLAGGASHLAGQAGHRWGWLIKMVGWQKARHIAAMGPKKRLATIAALRRGALRGYRRATMLERARTVQAATTTPDTLAPESSAGHAAAGAQGAGCATGPGGGYGDPALFMGA